jgi:hypothetical protein
VVLQQADVAVYRVVQPEPADELVNGANTAMTDSAGPLRDFIDNVRLFEHRFGLILELLPLEPGFKILLVSEVDVMVSFFHLECAPVGCVRKTQIPITTNNDAHSRVVSSNLIPKSRWFRV